MAAVQAKLSITRGAKAQNVVLAAGAAISGSDAMFVNIDQTLMSKFEALQALDELRKYVHEHGWPISGA
jgi:hypothetical protein